MHRRQNEFNDKRDRKRLVLEEEECPEPSREEQSFHFSLMILGKKGAVGELTSLEAIARAHCPKHLSAVSSSLRKAYSCLDSYPANGSEDTWLGREALFGFRKDAEAYLLTSSRPASVARSLPRRRASPTKSTLGKKPGSNPQIIKRDFRRGAVAR